MSRVLRGPSTAAWLLLRVLSGAGAQLLVSADRDAAGESIAGELMTELTGHDRGSRTSRAATRRTGLRSGRANGGGPPVAR
jgi:hypothetical protein